MSPSYFNAEPTHGFFHVYNRGVNRGSLFNVEQEYTAFLDLIQRHHDAGGISIHTYTLMPNHFHFILRQEETLGMSGFMKAISQNYAVEYNARHQRVGHLFQGRFKRKLVKNAKHLLDLSRYIHINPVSAHLVDNPFDWPYGSCKSFLSSDCPPFLTSGVILDLAGGPEEYRRFLIQPPSYLDSDIETILIDHEMP